MIVTSVSTCGLQRQSNKGKLSSNEVVKSPRLQIEHMNSHDKIIQWYSIGAFSSPRESAAVRMAASRTPPKGNL